MHMHIYTHLNTNIHMQNKTKINMVTHEIKYLKVSTIIFQLVNFTVIINLVSNIP